MKMAPRALALFVSSCLAGEAATAANSAPQVSIPLKEAPAGRLAPDRLIRICSRLPVPCNPASTRAYLASLAGPRTVYLIDGTKPMLVALNAEVPDDPGLARQWDFSAYRHSLPAVSGDLAAEPLQLYPALYAVDGNRYAVALVGTVQEMYSGGGATFQVADFIGLSGDGEGSALATSWTVVYATIPFSCHKTVRACFSEKERKASHHCLEESSGYLTIQHASAPGSAGPWAFTWNESNWPPHVDKTKSRQDRRPFTLPPRRKPAELPDGVSFCGGPAS